MVRIVCDGPESRDPALRARPMQLKRSTVVTLGTSSPRCDSVRLIARGFSTLVPPGLGEDAPFQGITLPVHVLVPRNVARWQTDSRVQHQTGEPLPKDSLVRVEPGLLLSSPEHIVLHEASRLDPLPLTWLISEMCACYTIHPSLGGPLFPARPLTSLSKIAAYLEEAVQHSAYGAKKALRATGFAVEGAASPRELVLALCLTLPRAMGGYAVPKPRLNHRVNVDRRIRAMYKRSHFTVDACWPQARLAVEYDSDSYHLDPVKRAQDNDRRAALEEMGYRVIPISTKQQDGLVLSDNAFQRIAKHLGVKNRTGEMRYDWQARRSDLRRRLWSLAAHGVDARPDGARA